MTPRFWRKMQKAGKVEELRAGIRVYEMRDSHPIRRAERAEKSRCAGASVALDSLENGMSEENKIEIRTVRGHTLEMDVPPGVIRESRAPGDCRVLTHNPECPPPEPQSEGDINHWKELKKMAENQALSLHLPPEDSALLRSMIIERRKRDESKIRRFVVVTGTHLLRFAGYGSLALTLAYVAIQRLSG